jgi:hypothetical protein
MDNEENVTTTTALVGLQDQLNTVRFEISSINSGLQNISSLLQTDSFLDQQKLLREREQEKILAEREIRAGQENELQQRVSATIAQPVAKLEKKLTSTFDGVTSALKSLFLNPIGKGLKGASTLALKGVLGIGNILKNSFTIIGAGIAALWTGFGSIIGSITGITGKISKSILSLAASPFKAIADVFKKFVPGFAPVATAVTSVGGAVSLAQNASEGDVPGMILSGVSIVPGPLQFPAAILNMGYEGFTGGGIDFGKMFPKDVKLPSIPNVDFGGMFESMKNSLGEMGQNVSNFFNVDLGAPAKTIEGNVQSGNTQSSRTSSVAISPQSLQPAPRSGTENLNNLSEPKPDIIYASTGQQSQSSAGSGETQILTDVPLIPSSNPDNFYTLYSQVSYNVVI